MTSSSEHPAITAKKASKITAWIGATRPKTLAAGAVPVFVGTALAAHELLTTNWLVCVLCLVVALGMQITTNFANDAIDGLKGTDGPDRLGPQRLVASGIVSAKTMLTAAVITAVITLLAGIWLSSFGGPLIFWLGILSLVCAFAYTGGPAPLAYVGLGDLFVLIFFGFVATIGSAWVQLYNGNAAQTLHLLPYWWWFIAAVVGLQATAIIAINNHRDRDTDVRTGKMTLAARLGTESSIHYQCALPALTVACLITATWMSGLWALGFAVIPALIGGLIICRHLAERDGAALNGTLALAGITELITGFAVTIILFLA